MHCLIYDSYLESIMCYQPFQLSRFELTVWQVCFANQALELAFGSPSSKSVALINLMGCLLRDSHFGKNGVLIKLLNCGNQASF